MLPEQASCQENGVIVGEVYQALLAHDGPITKFELAIPGMRRRRYIDLLMLYLSRRDVQELILLFEGRDCPLHSSLFSAFHHLRSLKLGNCEFSPPSPLVGFGKLNFLELENIILPAGFYDHFLVACPLLEELRVLDCYDHDDDEEQEHQFVSPSLKVLLFRSEIGKLCFRHTPLLSVLSVSDTADFEFDFDDVNDQWKLDMVALFGSLPSLEQLHLGGALLILLAADVHVPRQLPTLLHQLRVIEIPHMSLNNLSHVRVLVCLIMSSPNLQQLTIGIEFDKKHPESEVSLQRLLEAEDYNGVICLEHLRELNIKGSLLMQVELDLVRFVLANAPLLRKISIKSEMKLRSRKALNFLKDVRQYKRISKEAEVRYVCSLDGDGTV
ncbi:F-box/FBD/LRR-repeat protein At1g13570 [Linum grandiflorum]